VRKNRPSSGSVVSAGEVAEGEIITMPFGMATLVSIARVTPEQSPPMMPLTPSAVIARSAAAVAAAASVQVSSPRTGMKLWADLPEAFTSAIASSAAAAMWPVSDSIGPVKPIRMPSLTSSAEAAPVIKAQAEAASSSFFICCFSLFGTMSFGDPSATEIKMEDSLCRQCECKKRRRRTVPADRRGRSQPSGGLGRGWPAP
jgi:hypothetical protein